MTVKLGTNITALSLRQQFGRAAEDLSTATQRLASGQRIVRPSDDAAGIAIAEKLRSETRIYTQGIRNLNEGISAISIAEGAMNEMARVLERIDELAKQSQNGVLTQNQRNVMQQEVTALQSEWNRIIESTKYNGMQLLTGNDPRLVLQGGTEDAGTLAVQFGEAQLAGGIEGFAGTISSIGFSSTGVEANGLIFTEAMTPDGRFVVFSASSTNLVPGDTNGQTDLFLRDTITGTVTRVSTDSSGNQANENSQGAAISADGRYIVFTSTASNLVAGDTNNSIDVFMKDTLTGLTTRINTSSTGAQAFGAPVASPTANVSISADGRYVVFTSGDTNLVSDDSNGLADIFVKDTLTGLTTRVNTTSSGAQAIGDHTREAQISADGRYVVFTSGATNLVADDTNGVTDTFMKDLLTGVTTRISTSGTGVQSNGASAGASVTADGRYVVFASEGSNLVGGDGNGASDIFLKDTHTGLTTLVSTNSSGIQGNTGSGGPPVVSADGRFVAFRSGASNLVADDTNGIQDVFVKDLYSGAVTRASVGPDGTEVTGEGKEIRVSSISADGRSILFTLRDDLPPSDSDGASDGFLRDLTRTGVNQLAGLIVSNRVSAGVTQALTARARQELTIYRARLGTSLTRINSFVNTLGSATINLQEAAARITDADIAAEASRAVAARVRQEVTAKLLKQTNMQPSLALLLLKG